MNNSFFKFNLGHSIVFPRRRWASLVCAQTYMEELMVSQTHLEKTRTNFQSLLEGK